MNKKRKIDTTSLFVPNISEIIETVKLGLENENFDDTLEYLENLLDENSTPPESIKRLLFPLFHFYIKYILLPNQQVEKAVLFMSKSLKYSSSLDIYVELITSSSAIDNSNLTDSNETLKTLIDSTCYNILQNSHLFTCQSSEKESQMNSPSVKLAIEQDDFTEWEMDLFTRAFQDPLTQTFHPASLNELLDPLNGFSLKRLSQLEPLSFPFSIQEIHPVSTTNETQTTPTPSPSHSTQPVNISVVKNSADKSPNLF